MDTKTRAFNFEQADSSSRGKWQTIFDDSCNQLLSIEPNCPAVLLMRGLLQLTNKKAGWVKEETFNTISNAR